MNGFTSRLPVPTGPARHSRPQGQPLTLRTRPVDPLRFRPSRSILRAAMLLALVCPAAATGAAAPGDAPALEVVLAGPRGEQEAVYSIDVTFSEPMVRLGERGRRENDGPLRFSPPLRGHFSWLGTTTVSFLPETPVPRGTRLACTIAQGTKSLAGRALAQEFAWTIEVGRPRFLRSLPPPAPEAGTGDAPPALPAHPPEEPLLLAFDQAPDPAALERVSLTGPEGPIPCALLAARTEFAEALFGRDAGRDQPHAIVALQPAAPLVPGASYLLRIPSDLSFSGSALPLGREVAIPFLAVAPPVVRSIEASDGGLLIEATNPLDPDSTLARLEITPRPRDLEAGRDWGQTGRVRIQGRFRAGGVYRVRLPAGLPDLFGGRTQAPFQASVVQPHAMPQLTIAPPTGILLPDPEPFARIEAMNTGPVAMRATWITSEEMPLYFDRDGGANPESGRRHRGMPRRPWESRWIDLPVWNGPAGHPDSVCVWQRALADFGPRPAGAHALLIEARAPRLYPPEQPWEPESLEDLSLLRVSSIGISCTLGQESGLLWITDLATGRPVPGALVSLWAAPDSTGTPVRLWQGRTDGEGLATAPGRRLLRPRGEPILARAEAKRGATWLELDRWWDEESETDAGREANTGFLFTDRAIYRPGETVRWKAYVRNNDPAGLLPATTQSGTVRLQIRDRRIESTVRFSGPGNADGELVLPADAPTGPAHLRITIETPRGGSRQIASASLAIEAFRAPRFGARVAVERARLLSGATAVVHGRFAYFAGAPVAGRSVRWTVMRQPLYLQLPGWDGYSFLDPRPGRGYGADWIGPARIGEGTATTDANGQVRLDLPLVLPPDEGDARVTVEMELRDLSDQAAADRAQIELLRSAIRPAVQADWRDTAGPGQASWRWAVVDTGGRAVPGVAAELELVRREWKTVRIRRLGGRFDYENTAVDSTLAVVAAASGAEASLQTFAIERGGLYLMRARLRAEDGTLLSAADLRYVEGDDAAAFPRETSQWLDLELDREAAASGDTVRVVIPAPASGAEGLLLLESGGILRAERLSLRGTPALAVPIGQIAPPDLTLTAILVGPDLVPADDGGGPRRSLPYFARGSRTLRIRDDAWRLQVDVEPARPVAFPGEEIEVTLRLRDADGRPVSGEATIAVVDEAVLALAAEPDPDPLHALFRYRGSGTQYDDTRYLLRLLPEEEKGASSPGGGGAEAAAAMGRLRTRFDITAYWNPSIPVGPDGTATVRFHLPDDLTRYRIRATAASDAGRFGFGDGKIQVDRPLSVEAALPRFVRVGDAWRAGALLQNRTAAELPVRLSCRVEGGRITGKSEWSGTLAPGATRRIDLPIATPDPGRCRVTLSVRALPAAGGAIEDAVRREIPVEVAVDRITEVAFGRAAPRGEETLRLDDPGLAGSSRFTAQIAPSVVSDLSDPITWLVDYPHACVEQVCSRLLGLLARRTLGARLPPDTLTSAGIEAGLRTGLAELHSRLDADGFRIWPQGEGGEPYLDAYALLTLARLRAAGVTLPDGLFEEALGVARSHLERHDRERQSDARPERDGRPAERPPAGERDDLDAFLLWARAEADDPQLRDAEFERLALSLDRLSEAARLAYLLGLDRHAASHAERPALRASAGKQIGRVLESLAAEGGAAARTAQWDARSGARRPRWSSRADDQVRVQALGLLLLVRAAPDHPLLPRFAQGLIDARRHGRWANTHENALAIDAIRAYAEALERLQLPLQGRLVLGLDAIEGLRFTEGAMAPRAFSYTIPQLAALRRAAADGPDLPVRIETDGRGTLYYQLRLDRFRPALELPPAEEGMVLLREWIDAASGRPVRTLRRGGTYWVHLALVVPRDSDFLSIEDPLPAGIEAVNLRLRTTARFHPAPGEQSARSDPTAGGVRLPVEHRDLLDQAARFYADEVPAGVYHLYYPVAATTPGRFGVPGARAELLYEPEVYAVSGAETVVVE